MIELVGPAQWSALMAALRRPSVAGLTADRRQNIPSWSRRFFRFERRHGSFSRAVGLPAGVDDSKIAASYDNGVLEVRVPKPEEARPRRIQLGSAPADVDASAN